MQLDGAPSHGPGSLQCEQNEYHYQLFWLTVDQNKDKTTQYWLLPKDPRPKLLRIQFEASIIDESNTESTIL